MPDYRQQEGVMVTLMHRFKHQRLPRILAIKAQVDQGRRLGEYDRSHELVVDPVTLVYCGYIGGAAFDQAFWADVGPDGAVYVAGDTESGADTFPDGQGMPGHLAPVSDFGGGSDAFIVKLDARQFAPPSGEPTATPADPEPTPTAEPVDAPAEGTTVYLPRVVRE